jgi:DNA polymerase elongation subunit (family B)
MIKAITFQAYKWEVEETTEETIIYIFGLDAKNKSVAVKVPDFKPYVYLELDPAIVWSEAKVQLLKTQIKALLKDHPPVAAKFVSRKKNYFYRPAKMLLLQFTTKNAIKHLERLTKKKLNIPGVGFAKLQLHEQRADPTLQLFATRQIKPASWIVAKETSKETILNEHGGPFSTAKKELISSYLDLSLATDQMGVTNPLILSYDIECISGDSSGNTFPDPTRKTDQVICISATVARFKDSENTWRQYCLVNEDQNKKCPKLKNDTDIRHFTNEKETLLGWSDFINELDPDVIIGYNTLSFDDRYLIERANVRMCWPRFSKMGRLIGKRSTTEERNWSSSAYGEQKFNFINIPGRLHLDMYPVIFKDYGNLMSYTLDYVSEYFLKEHKIDLPAKEMIQRWHSGTEDDIRQIVLYCNKDTILPMKLMKKLNSWLGLIEMANVMMVPVFDLVTRGQQIRVFSQIYCLARELGIVCTDKWTDYKPADSEKEFVGATVQNPKTGYWENVATYDFKSLYPTTIIAYNICFSTFIPDCDNPPEDQYHDLRWTEHQGCEHDTAIRKTKITKKICRSHHYRFYKASIKKGIVPMILEQLLGARANTRKEIGVLSKRLKDNSLNASEKLELNLQMDVLDKRQLGYKVSANSVPGNTPIPCMIDGCFKYLAIEELASIWIEDQNGNQVATPEAILVWSDSGWTAIKYVIRHKHAKPLQRIVTHAGVVDCTEEHSLLTAHGIPVKPTELKRGDPLLQHTLPLPADTQRPEQSIEELQQLNENDFTTLEEITAFIHGRVGRFPNDIFAEPYKIRLAFITGYLHRSGQPFDSLVTMAKFIYLSKTLGYKLSCIPDFPRELTKQDKPNVVQEKITGPRTGGWVYDLETANHHFAAGVGDLIVHNSMYGGFGSDYSYTPFYPAAASTTAMGRKSIQDAIDYAQKFRPDTVLVYGDSVTADTPILLRNPEGQIIVSPIEEIHLTLDWQVYDDFKPTFTEPIDSSIEYHVAEESGVALLAARHMFNKDQRWFKESKLGEGWKVWTDQGWSEIKKIIRHKTAKKIYRVTTYSGSVDVTQDHSLLTEEKEIIKPVDVKLGTRLLHSFPTDLKNWDFAVTDDESPKMWAQKMWLMGKKLNIGDLGLMDSCMVGPLKTFDPLEVRAVESLGPATDYVYDLETECGRFQAGVGELIVKNTDSCMLKFSQIHNLKECFRVCEDLEHAINDIFPKPMYLELEKIYSKYFLLSKKRYVGYIVDPDGKLLSVDKKGVVIKRRDNCGYLREIYSNLVDMVMAKKPRWVVYNYLAEKIADLLNGEVDLEKLVITKSIKSDYKVANLPHVAVANKMRDRGKYVATGTRIRYIFIKTANTKDPQYVKAEDPDYYLENQETVKIDYMYYLEKQLINPIDEVLETKFGVKDTLKNLYKCLQKGLIKKVDDYFKPQFKIN